MKRLGPLLLLLSFLTGAVQPILPMLEYHLFKEMIAEELCENRDDPESDCDGSCYLADRIHQAEEKQSDMTRQHVDFYPIYVTYGKPVMLDLNPGSRKAFFTFDESLPEIPRSVLTPPPRFG